MFARISGVFCAMLAMILQSNVSTAQSIPVGGVELFKAQDTASLELAGKQSSLAAIEQIEVKGQSFAAARRISIASGATSEWNVQLKSPLLQDIRKDDVVLIHLWLRCVQSMTGDAQIGVVIEQKAEPNDKLIDRHLAASEKWTEVFVPFKAGKDLPKDDSQLCVRLGFDRQTIELANVEVLNFQRRVAYETLPRTQITYAGREADAAWRKEAWDRIDKLRKADLRLRVLDDNGKPVSDASIQVNLLRHQFGFGSCVTTELLTSESEDAKKYRSIVERYFNLAVFENDMKWPALYDGVPTKTDEALNWLLDKSIKVRGHNLIWPGWRWLPPQLKEYVSDPNRLREVVNNHITQTVSHFKGKLFQWDVVNEPFTNHDLMDLLGGDSVMVGWYRLAHEADPSCALYLNDFGILEGGQANEHREHFYNTIATLKEQGAPVHGIGIQSHFSSDLPSPSQVLAVFDRFAAFGLPIESTELSVNIEDADVQADYLRDYMITAFSHPKVQGIMLWGFWEKRHWRPKAALYRADWSIRPIGKAFTDLMESDFDTHATLTTDANGIAKVRGYLGDYEVIVTYGGKSVTQSIRLETNSTSTDMVLK